MKSILKYIVLACLLLLPVLGGEIEDLESTLGKIEVQVNGSKVIVDAMQIKYDEAVTLGDKVAISEATISLSQAKLYYNSISQELYKIKKIIDSLKSNTQDDIRGKSLDIPESISVELVLLPGWNSFSIPVNKSIPSSSQDLGRHSAIWTFDGSIKTWIKNPPILYPGRGYLLNITDGGYRLNFKGLSFSTDLSSIAKKYRTWYFAGASSRVNSIDYSKYAILKYAPYSYIKNPSTINSGDAFWVFKK